MCGINLKKFDGMVPHTANEDGDRGDDDATALLEDHRGGPEDGNSGVDDVAAPLEDHDGYQDNRGETSEDMDMPWGPRAVQVLGIRANFPIITINGFNGEIGQPFYVGNKDMQHEGEVRENGMVDLVLVGPNRIFKAYGALVLEVFYYTTAGDMVSIQVGWDVAQDEEVEEHLERVYPSPGRELEITFLVIPNCIEVNVEVRLKLKDLGSVSRAVYGKIKASATCYGNKSVNLFDCERGRSLFFPFGSTSILPLSPERIALPQCRQPELLIEVDLMVNTTCDSQESQEEDKNLKSTLKFARRITSQEIEVDGDQVEVNIYWVEDGVLM
ncbi:hypothetical protein ACP70R_045169 [Stipagrostis hirtigluma subsp. patula]